MTPLKILVVEDIVLTAISLKNSLEKYGYIVTGIARTYAEAREAVLESAPDLALVDIILEESEFNGIETAEMLAQLHPMPIIFLTANSEFEQFQRAQKTKPAAYLLKPFRISDIVFNVELAYHNFRPVSAAAENLLEGQIMLPTNGGLEMIDLEEVMYLKAGGAYAEVIMADETRHLVSVGLGQLEYYFNSYRFFRLSRSFVVNLFYIKRMRDGELVLKNEKTKIPVPENSRKELLNRITVVRTKPSKK
jgi:DNA-binding LytR/AlgR family response regulator